MCCNITSIREDLERSCGCRRLTETHTSALLQRCLWSSVGGLRRFLHMLLSGSCLGWLTSFSITGIFQIPHVHHRVVHQASIHITADRQPVGSSIRPKRSGKELQEGSQEIYTMEQRSAGEVIFNISFNQLCIKGWNHSPIFLSGQFLAKIDGTLQPCNKLQGVSPS